jgi:hypothetical protein
MASSDLNAVMDRLARADERRDREWKLTLREHRLNRRAYEEGMALCGQLVERHGAVIAENTRVIAENSRVIAEHSLAFEDLSQIIADAGRSIPLALAEMREEIRAQTRAIFAAIDRLDRLDGGSAPA